MQIGQKMFDYYLNRLRKVVLEKHALSSEALIPIFCASIMNRSPWIWSGNLISISPIRSKSNEFLLL
jgi:hypothetical protein